MSLAKHIFFSFPIIYFSLVLKYRTLSSQTNVLHSQTATGLKNKVDKGVRNLTILYTDHRKLKHFYMLNQPSIPEISFSTFWWLIKNNNNNNKTHSLCWSTGSPVSTGCFPRRPGFNSLHSHGSSQSFLTPVPGNAKLPSGLQPPGMHVIQRYK